MKIGDLVKYLHPGGVSDHSQNRFVHPRDVYDHRRHHSQNRWIGLVVEVHGDDEYRVKWFGARGPIWYSKKKLEVVNESR